MGCMYCSGPMCVGVTVWFGWGGVVTLGGQPKDPTPPQPNHTVTTTHTITTHIETEQYNP